MRASLIPSLFCFLGKNKWSPRQRRAIPFGFHLATHLSRLCQMCTHRTTSCSFYPCRSAQPTTRLALTCLDSNTWRHISEIERCKTAHEEPSSNACLELTLNPPQNHCPQWAESRAGRQTVLLGYCVVNLEGQRCEDRSFGVICTSIGFKSMLETNSFKDPVKPVVRHQMCASQGPIITHCCTKQNLLC